MSSKKEYLRQYYLDNKDKLIKRAKNWALSNPDKIKEISRRWRLNNKDKEVNRQSRYIRQNIEKYLYRLARHRSQKKGMMFNITIDDIKIPILCPLLRVPLGVDFGTWNVPTLDRLDNSKGYVKGNIVVMSKRANMLKNNANATEIIFLGMNLAYLEGEVSS